MTNDDLRQSIAYIGPSLALSAPSNPGVALIGYFASDVARALLRGAFRKCLISSKNAALDEAERRLLLEPKIHPKM